MNMEWIYSTDLDAAAPADLNHHDLGTASLLEAAARGDPDALYALGIACSVGTGNMVRDLIEAHKWFNLAAVAGHLDAPLCRGEVAMEMQTDEIAEAQRRARTWLTQPRKIAV